MDEQHRIAGSFISGWTKVLLLTHERPDGDAVGCLAGLYRMLQACGKKPAALCFDPPPSRYANLLESADIRAPQDVDWHEELAGHDGVIVADTCSLQQLSPAADALRARKVPVLAIDHHVTRDDIADCCLIDESASSASLLVLEWAETMDWPIDARTAAALFTGIATDTGWFRFSNTDSRTLAAAGRLVDLGVRPDELYQAYYMADAPARARLVGEALTGIAFHCRNRVAVLCVTQDMLERCGASRTDTDDLINEAMRIGVVECSLLLTALDPGIIKVSLRSKHELDCAKVAGRFGGGGHVRAAGARIKGVLQDAKQSVLKEVASELGAQPPGPES